MHGPDDARGRRHARQGRGALRRRRCGPIPSTRRIPSVAAVCVYPNLVPRRRGAARRQRRQGRRRWPRPSRPASRRLPLKLDGRRARPSRPAPTRSTWSSTAAPSCRAATRRCSTRSCSVKEACGDAHLKVILETGELGTYDNVRRASLLAMAAGADFIKTSTGKVSTGRDAARVARACSRRSATSTRRPAAIVGFKPAGGIRTAKQAIQHLVLVNETLGADWLTPDLLPPRRLLAAQRRADADPQASAPALPVARLLHHRLSSRRAPTATRARPASSWEYAPVARAPRHRPARRSATACSSAASSSSRAPASGSPRSRPATEEPLAEVAQAGEEDVDLAVGAARERVRERLVGAATGRARQVPVPHRAHPAGALARVRRAGVARRRQADQGVARRRPAARRRALLLLRRLGGQARVRVPEPRRPRPLGVAGAGHPVELPAADAGVEDRAGARRRQHGRAEAGRDDAAHRAAVRRRLRQAELPPGVVNIVTGDGSTGARAGRATRASTRSRSPARPRSARRSSASSPGSGKRADARARRQGGEHRLRRRRARPGRRGDRQRHLLQPGPRLLRRLAAARAGVDRRARSSPS